MTDLRKGTDVQLLESFIKTRARRAERKTAYADADASDKQAQEAIESEFLRRFNERGIDNVSKNGIGTAYRSNRASATVGDWEAFLTWVQDNDEFDMLERRVSKTAVQEYKDQNADLPPGVKWSEMHTVNFRAK